MEENIELMKVVIPGLSTIIGAIVGGILGGLITYFSCFSKARKEQRAKIIGKNMERRSDALEEIKNVIQKLSVFERSDITHPREYINRPMQYNAIFENYDTLEKFMNEYSDMRSKYDKYIDGRLFYYICAGTQYLMLFLQTVSIGLGKDKEAPYTVGIFVYNEVDNWKREVYNLIINEQNNPKYKYKRKSGKKYEKKLAKIVGKLEETVLYTQFIKKLKLDNEKLSEKFSKGN